MSELTIAPITDEDGNVSFLVGITRDISIDAEIDRMKTEFISLASHQLRTPLGAMKWLLHVLISEDAGPLNEEQKEVVRDIQVSNETMLELVRSLLNISSIDKAIRFWICGFLLLVVSFNSIPKYSLSSTICFRYFKFCIYIT